MLPFAASFTIGRKRKEQVVSIRIKDILIIGLAFFALFFGAGNLIFPPYLGAEGGSQWFEAFAGFVLIDVIITSVGLWALNRAGGSSVALDAVLDKGPALALNTLAILCTGVLIAAPRTAATTYEMSVQPFFGDSIGLLPVSIVFFAIVLALTYRQSRLVDIVGRFLTPVLVVCIVVLIVVGLVNPLGIPGAATASSPLGDGIAAGYQAMDILCIVGFAIVMQDTVRTFGYGTGKLSMKVTALACIVAAVLLVAIYGGLTYLGATVSNGFDPTVSQAELLVSIAYDLMGQTGVAILGVIVGFACLTTAIGLSGAAASYFERITKGRIRYRPALVAIVAVNALLCNLGLSAIIELAQPILDLVIPPFMTTVMLILFVNRIRSIWTYRGAAAGATLASAVLVLHSLTGALPIVEALPLYSVGFAWIPFAILGGVAGAIGARISKSCNPNALTPAQRVQKLLQSSAPPADELSASADASADKRA